MCIRDRPYRLAMPLLACYRNALFQHIHGDVRLLAAHNERRSDTDTVRPTSQQQDAALEGELDDAIAFRNALRFGLLVGDNLDSDHQAASADVAHQIEPLRPTGDALHDVFSHHLGVLDAFTFQDVHGGKRSCDRDWVPSESRSVRARNPVHDFSLCHHDAERHTAGDPLSAAEDVGLNASVLDGPPLSGAARARLHFIRHQQDAMAVANPAKFLHEYRRRDNVASLTLNRLDKNCGHFSGASVVLNNFSSMKRAQPSANASASWLPPTHPRY